MPILVLGVLVTQTTGDLQEIAEFGQLIATCFVAQPQSHEKIIERRSGRRRLGEARLLMGRFEFLGESFVFGLVEFEVGSVERSFFGAGLFLGDEIVEVGQLGGFVQRDEVSFDDAGSHQVDAGQKNAVNVQQRFDSRRRFLGE